MVDINGFIGIEYILIASITIGLLIIDIKRINIKLKGVMNIYSMI